MAKVKIVFLKKTETCEVGEVVSTTKESADNYVSQGYAKYVNNELKENKKKNKKTITEELEDIKEE